MKMNRKTFYIALIGMEVVIAVVAVIIDLVMKKNIFAELSKPMLGLWLGFTLLGGLLAGAVPSLVAKLSFITDTYNRLVESILEYELTISDCVIISLIAGFCEELLFRGALQPILGIWITSAVFVLIHGYFNPLDWRKTLLGATAFLMSVAAGFLYAYHGLAHSMIFHFAYDLSAYIIILQRQKRIRLHAS